MAQVQGTGTRQGSTGPVAEFVLRGHAYPVTSLEFSSGQPPTLASGDEGGWVIWWNLVSRRPTAVWRAHGDNVIIAVRWMSERHLLTHGRDNKVRVWRLESDDVFDSSVPTQGDTGTKWKKPWLEYVQDVNALNFCGAVLCGRVMAVPSTMDSDKIDVYRIMGEQPERLVKALRPPVDSTTTAKTKTGSVMALLLTEERLVAGYESGAVIVYDLVRSVPAGVSHVAGAGAETRPRADSGVSAKVSKLSAALKTATPLPPVEEQRNIVNQPAVLSIDQTHTQPVLSLALDGSGERVLSSAADSNMVEIDLATGQKLRTLDTKHAGLGAVAARRDGKILATAGWDGNVRVYSYKTLKPLAVFRAGRQNGITSLAFSVPAGVAPGDAITSFSELATVADRFAQRVTQSNWLAVSGKDGRIAFYALY